MVSIEELPVSESPPVDQLVEVDKRKEEMIAKLLQKALPVCTVATEGKDEDAHENNPPLNDVTLTEEQTRQLRELYAGGGGASAKARAADYEKKTIAAKILRSVPPVCTIAADDAHPVQDDRIEENQVLDSADATDINADATEEKNDHGASDESSSSSPPQELQQRQPSIEDGTDSLPPDLKDEDAYPSDLESMMESGPNSTEALYDNTTATDLEPYDLGTNAQLADQELAFLLDSLQIADPAINDPPNTSSEEAEVFPEDEDLLAAMDELDINDDETLMALYAMMIEYEEQQQQKIQSQCMPCDVMPKLRFLADND